MGFFSECGIALARLNFGWKPVGSAEYSAFETAWEAFTRFGADWKKASKYLTETETRHYNALLEKYPGGYDDYRKQVTAEVNEELLNKPQCRTDQFEAWENELIDRRRAVKKAELAMTEDRRNGIHRPRGYYRLGLRN